MIDLLVRAIHRSMRELSPFQSWLVSQPPGTSTRMVEAGIASRPTVARLTRDPDARVSPLVALRIHAATEGAVPFASLVRPAPADRGSEA